MAEHLCLAVLMPLWPPSMPGLERLTFSLYTFEGQKMAPRERTSISAAATWIIMLFSGSDILYAVCVGSYDSDGKNDSSSSQREERTK